MTRTAIGRSETKGMPLNELSANLSAFFTGFMNENICLEPVCAGTAMPAQRTSGPGNGNVG